MLMMLLVHSHLGSKVQLYMITISNFNLVSYKYIFSTFMAYYNPQIAHNIFIGSLVYQLTTSPQYLFFRNQLRIGDIYFIVDMILQCNQDYCKAYFSSCSVSPRNFVVTIILGFNQRMFVLQQLYLITC